MLLEGAGTFHTSEEGDLLVSVAFLREAKPLLEDNSLGSRKAEGDMHVQWWS